MDAQIRDIAPLGFDVLAREKNQVLSMLIHIWLAFAHNPR
jgi:hypothetical protein